MNTLHHIRNASAVALTALAVITGSSATSPVTAKGGFDGTWSVLIVTEQGTCDRAYRYPIRISNGALANAGDTAFDISGKVAANGAIIVKVSRGKQSALGSGRLSAAGGGGSWKAGSCAGTWTAERRGS